MKRIMIVTTALFAIAACDSTTEPGVRDDWTAAFEGIGEYEELTADVEVEARETTFTVSISVAGGSEGDEFEWHVAEGACATPGERLGAATAYAAIEVDAEGEGSATAQVVASLHGDGTYHVRLFTQDGDEDPETVACGQLTRDNG